MIVHDYNGDGIWAADEIIRRYAEYAREFRVVEPVKLAPRIHEKGERRWVYPVMDEVILGIELGDLACVQIGVEFIELDHGFTFGAILKSNTARSLRRFPSLTDKQVSRIRRRVVGLLTRGVVPREYREYCRLLRAVGVGPHADAIRRAVPKNHYAKRTKAYLLRHGV